MRLIRLLRIVRIYKKANSAVNKLNDNSEFRRLAMKHRAYQKRKERQEIEDSKRLIALSSANDNSIEVSKFTEESSHIPKAQ
jgi:hypothetical protein